MHHNAPLPDKKIKKISGEGAQDTPCPDPAPSAPRFSHLQRSAFPFLFIYDSNTDRAVNFNCLFTVLLVYYVTVIYFWMISFVATVPCLCTAQTMDTSCSGLESDLILAQN